ncbi:MAG TPA: alpha/beta hydrolase-fold protein [Parafilimonas sp.]|nr:alpha/beta hydrolase-fold protein [Parafilimonas sp.]
MKKFSSGFFCLVFLHVFIPAFSQPAGKVVEQETISSTILGRSVRYTVYLPADYDISQRSYPVVYLLHGFTDDNTGWLQFGEINRYADKAIANGTIPPMAIIMPNADSSWYINSYDGKENYEDFFIKEFMPFVEKKYRIKAEKKYRGVAGLSMGGYGTLIYALKYPQLFAAAAPLSAGIFTSDELKAMPDNNYANVLARVFGSNLKGDARLTNQWYANSVLDIVAKESTDSLKRVRYWIDCGDDDFLTNANCLLHIALTNKHVPHEFRMRDGAHNWTYWRTGITDALQFIGDSFHQK